MQSYSQRDPRWADVKVGATQQTLGRVGCLITSISDISSFFGSNYKPDEIARVCKFTGDARLFWDSASFSDFAFAYRDRYYNAADVSAKMKDTDWAVVFEMQNGAHWVTPIRWSLLHNCWMICDPWWGDVCPITRYAKEPTGVAFFRRKGA